MEDYKENLKTYIKEDIIYQEYLKNKNKNFSDFDKFCIQHCKDIEELLEENEKLKAEYGTKTQIERDFLKEENEKLKAELQLYQGALKRENEAIHRVNELEEVIDEAKEIIMQPNIEIREYHSCDMDYVYVNEQLLEILKVVE